MGMYHSTYFAYGIHVRTSRIAWEEADHADAELPKIKGTCPDVGHLSAGDYDHDMFFLVTECADVELGKFKHVTPNTVTPEQIADWNRQLTEAATALGYSDTTEPGWLVVPDVS